MEKNENIIDSVSKLQLISGLIILIIVITLYYIYTMYTIRIERITVKSKYILNDKYYKLIVSSIDGKTYNIGNNIWFLHYTSVELWDSLKEGENYDVVVYGSRIPVLDIFPVIIKSSLIK